MFTPTSLLLAALIFAAALLYASVGQAGASSYLAIMALFGMAPEIMKPTALTLNIIVAAIASIQFYRAGQFNRSLFWPFALGSVPFSFIGGAIMLPGPLYRPVVGIFLLFAAYRLLRSPENSPLAPPDRVRVGWALAGGAVIGLLSGLTGLGGGILLAPLLLMLGWTSARQTPGVTAPFILVNSIAGLLGHLSSVALLPAALPVWAVAAAAGGFIGAQFGSRRLGGQALRRLLAAVLIVAGIRLILP